MEKYHSMVPPLDHFQGKNKNRSSIARMISTSRGSFFANLTTFEQRSGLKKISHLKITILKMLVVVPVVVSTVGYFWLSKVSLVQSVRKDKLVWLY